LKYSIEEYISGDKCSICALGIDGRYPLLDFIDENEHKYERDVSEIIRYMERLSEVGEIRNNTKFRSLGDGLYEIKSGTNGLRVTCFWYKGKLLICGHCFKKGSQKTPKRHLRHALKLKSEFEAQKKKEKLS